MLDDSWTVAPAGRPALIAGMWADAEDANALRAREDLHLALDARGFSHWDEPGRRGGWMEFGKKLPLDDIVAIDGERKPCGSSAAQCSKSCSRSALPELRTRRRLYGELRTKYRPHG